MPPSYGEISQSPDSKSTGGLASVFKSLTGGRSTKSPPAQTPANASIPAVTVQAAPQLNISATPSTANDGASSYDDLYNRLKSGSSISDRARAADAIRLAIDDDPLTDVTNIWQAARDLINPDNPTEARLAAFGLFTACVKHSATDQQRKEYFDAITAELAPEDFYVQLTSLVALAKGGRDISGFYYEVLPLLTKWLGAAFKAFEAARKQPKDSSSRLGRFRSRSETSLHELFELILAVIKFNSTVTTEDETAHLIDELLHIAVSAFSAVELGHCVGVLTAIVTYGTIPTRKIAESVRVLCSIFFIVKELRSKTWDTISNLCTSHNKYTTVHVLLEILRKPQITPVSKSNQREIRGCLLVLEKIIPKDGKHDFPKVHFGLLMSALASLLTLEQEKIELDVLKLILAVLATEEDGVNKALMKDDWSKMLEIVVKCSSRVPGMKESISHESRSGAVISVADSATTSENATTVAAGMSRCILQIITKIEEAVVSAGMNELLQKDECMMFFARVHDHIPDSCAKLVIEHFVDFRLCYPSEAAWERNINLMLSAFFSIRSRPTTIRLQALKAVTDVYEIVVIMGEESGSDQISAITRGIVADLAEEKDPAVLHEVITTVVSVADTCDMELFQYLIKELRHTVSSDRLQSPISSPPLRITSLNSPASASITENTLISTSSSNIITRGFVQMFMRSMYKSADKAFRVFDEILSIAKSKNSDTDARISAMKMLFRLRADWTDKIFLTTYTESDGLAACLYRTAASLANKQAEDEAIQQQGRTSRNEDLGHTRSFRSSSSTQIYTMGAKASFTRVTSGVNRAMQPNHQMWMTPDPDALPEIVSADASLLLASVHNDENPQDLSTLDQKLRVQVWLDAITTLLQQGCDWEAYSYILVHLPSQLANLALFKSAVPQIQELRKVICGQIMHSSFHEPPLSSGLRKADVSICLFQILTMLISYHIHFTRNEEDEIVRCFVHGVTTWERASKSCIHALSICCHELPASMRSSLFNTLQKMSQIITQSHVAVHVLEFLVCLARLPELYANFRDEEYRFVFQISFRYLQYVRERAREVRAAGNRSSIVSTKVGTTSDTSRTLPDATSLERNLGPSTADDLPPYVHSLAYHVITFWFLSLRLSDRPAQVSWIIKNLVWTEDDGAQRMDEQGQVLVDFMQRTAYANVDESIANPDFTAEVYGEIHKRRWIVGNSIITVEQAIYSDWAQITKRQPSATSHYMVHEQFNLPPAHQELSIAGDSRQLEANLVLPSYVLLQLSTSTLSEAVRPIPLPDDDMVRRAISVFDRIAAVDGHKVGVIFIGEHQTEEVEILANVMGSSDYTDFLAGLGTLTKIQGATFNTAGLDRQYNTDGEYTYCWRDRVSEIVFHVTTLMPTNLEHYPQCENKKRHIGNDFVNIIWNNSGFPFNFNTFPSEFNYVNIVITPESRDSFVTTRQRHGHADSAFYKVQVMSKEGFPEISPAAETKTLSLQALPGFIRLLALNASVFSLVWANRAGGEHISSWRSRLREIMRLKEKYAPKVVAPGSTTSPPGTATSSGQHEAGSMSGSVSVRPRDSLITSRRASVATFLTTTSDHKEEKRSSKTYEEGAGGSGAVRESMIETLDFSKWA